MKAIRLALVLCMIAPCAHAQERVPWAWPSHREAAARISDVLVYTNMGAEAWKNFKADDRKRALGCQALREAVSIGITEIVKRSVNRNRPDLSDHRSFFSGHATQAAVNTGWNFKISIPIALGVTYLRPAANKHYVSDVVVGAGVGFLSRKVCKAS